MRYDLTDEQYARLLEASQPVSLIAIHAGSIMSPQEVANRAWEQVAKEHNCDFKTIQPYHGQPRSFTAEPLATLPFFAALVCWDPQERIFPVAYDSELDTAPYEYRSPMGFHTSETALEWASANDPDTTGSIDSWIKRDLLP